MKGTIGSELDQAEQAISVCSGDLADGERIYLPVSKAERSV